MVQVLENKAGKKLLPRAKSFGEGINYAGKEYRRLYCRLANAQRLRCQAGAGRLSEPIEVWVSPPVSLIL